MSVKESQAPLPGAKEALAYLLHNKRSHAIVEEIRRALCLLSVNRLIYGEHERFDCYLSDGKSFIRFDGDTVIACIEGVADPGSLINQASKLPLMMEPDFLTELLYRLCLEIFKRHKER